MYGVVFLLATVFNYRYLVKISIVFCTMRTDRQRKHSNRIVTVHNILVCWVLILIKSSDLYASSESHIHVNVLYSAVNRSTRSENYPPFQFSSTYLFSPPSTHSHSGASRLIKYVDITYANELQIFNNDTN